MNEKFLNNLLASALRRGEIDLELNDSVVDNLLGQTRIEASNESKARIKSKVKLRIEDTAISQSKRVIQWKGVPFGRYIEAVRERAGLTRFVIADRLGKDESYLLRLERGDGSPNYTMVTTEGQQETESWHTSKLDTEKKFAIVQLEWADQGYRWVGGNSGGANLSLFVRK